MKIELTKFAERHFNKSFNGTKILDVSMDRFVEVINEKFNLSEGKLNYGYADFCKLFFVENFTETKTGTLPITLENFNYLRTGYSSRRKEELAVLTRWFEIPYQFIPKAKFLNIVLYTREQLYNEWLKNPNKQKSEFELSEDCEFGIVAILAQMSDDEEPMTPITMMRNALGESEGGSGVSIDRKSYEASVKFWSENAIVK